MKQLVLIMCLVLISSEISAQDTSKKSAKSQKREYTQQEFSEAVYKELDKKMKKIGRSRLLDFAKELLQKEEELAKREELLVKKEEQIAVNEEELKKKIVKFTGAQEDFLACIDKEDKEVNRRIDHMVSVVSGMKPQTAANLLSQQDPSISVKILGMLDAVKVAKIFNLMEKEVSAKLQKQYMTLKK